jgi:NitT/TauT family transport system ATP-binding protein
MWASNRVPMVWPERVQMVFRTVRSRGTAGLNGADSATGIPAALEGDSRYGPAETMPKVIVSFRDVQKTYQSKTGPVAALQGISFDILEGEFLCIVGPSGGGKSTLLNLIAGLDSPEAGRVTCDNAPITGPGPDRVVIFQESALFPWLTVLGNVEFGLRMQKVGKAERRDRAREALKLVHLTRFADAYIHELSGGMKQRAALARALVMRPRILLMDEPFASLDAQTRDLLHTELQELWVAHGMTIVFVTHNVREAVCLGNRVLLLTARPGRIKREFAVELLRPRQIENAETMTLARTVLADLRQEVLQVFREEMGNGF